MTHGRAVALMLLATLLWSIAGVVTRWLDGVRGFEITFWRSAANALALVVLLSWLRGPRALAASLRRGGRALWLSGGCWCVMFTAFMMALSLTSVANVLVTMALAPLFTALMARLALGHRLAARTWAAIVLAGAGIAWMYGQELQGGRHLVGTLVAVAVPIAAALNWTLIQSLRGDSAAPDMLPAVLIGALLSAAITLPLAWPLQASLHDIGWLSLLGVVQLAIPCLISVVVARTLAAPEISLLALLEVLFGVAWAWLGANETPSAAVLGGGALVLIALAGNEALALRRR
ncbi:MAG TPA: DMT family transporter [Burkholderiaceae bacterium]|nr:DMT family transporter [Burkholderiaceae bacterium]